MKCHSLDSEHSYLSGFCFSLKFKGIDGNLGKKSKYIPEKKGGVAFLHSQKINRGRRRKGLSQDLVSLPDFSCQIGDEKKEFEKGLPAV